MKKNIIYILIFSPLLYNCSNKNLTSSAYDISAVNNSGSFSNPVDNGSAVSTIDQVDLTSKVEDQQNKLGVNGALAFDFDKTRGEFLILMPLPSGFVFTPQGTFKNYPDITFSPVYEASGKVRLAIRVPVKYIIKGLQFVTPTKLPNGDPLPMMPAGQNELPSLGLTFPQHDNTQISLYIGVNAIAVFMTIPPKYSFQLPVNITLPIKNKDKSKTYGYLTYVNPKPNFASGLFLSTIIPPKIATILEDYFKLN